jgi:hypothetical protein
MLINSLEKMEQIVSANKSLVWDGWTVVSLTQTNNGVMSSDGVKINGRWYLQKRYDAHSNGWDIPDKFVG